ncbi:GntR family transcriptional regulator [Paractinoplanes brasiliensis]|uniref:GntR family transcriptional regulator n=1 Tax=Paractinoplanes brasiliensis TaxID=52695 RepID=A0A4R6JT40_9ACTN|nr:GntR family transcriptional regulator [Actinoplanes brasiliensis]TDO38176.1 GntR family transcriptional regulator [Actinoplanes brasiliensis]
MSNGELRSYSLVELAVERLSHEILSGRAEPGERLVEEQLTRRLGISRAPLREAMRLLAQQGLVEHIPRRGARVATLSADDVRELYDVRDVLERHAVATMPANPDLTALRAALEVMRKATEADDRLELANAHRRFHTEVVALGGNRQLADLYGSVLVRIQLYMAVNMRREAEAARAEDGVLRHERLFAAVSANDAAEILAALSSHGARTYLS